MSITGRKKSIIVDTHQKTGQRAGYLFVLVFILTAIGISAIGLDDDQIAGNLV